MSSSQMPRIIADDDTIERFTHTTVNGRLIPRSNEDYMKLCLPAYRFKQAVKHGVNLVLREVLWSDKYYELKKEWIATRAFPYNSTKAYLAVLPRFFDARLKGRFKPNSVVIIASCYSLFTRDIADALGRRGLSIFIGWEGPVTLEHMDEALKLLIDKVFRGKLTWVEAVREVNEELGPDPIYGEELKIVIYGHHQVP